MTHLLTTGKVAKEYGLTRNAVWLAIKQDRLPARREQTLTGNTVYLIEPDDAERLFGYRRRPLAPARATA